MIDITKRFAKRLTKLREKNGMTQADLAILAGISRQSISLLELAQREPSLSSLIKLADALKVSMDELIGRNHSKEQ